MKKIYAEIGFGNNSFLSTEMEEGKKEYRVKKFIKPVKINDYYLRFWILKRVIIISLRDGLKFQKKESNKIKLLLGIGGVNT